MPKRIPDAFLDQLKQQTDLVELIAEYIPLKPAGANYKALCPFHHEKTPSFIVNPQKQFYHCFGCGASGNAIRFLMDYQHLSFIEAVQELAQRAGLELPQAEEQSIDHRPDYQLMSWAQQRFQQALAQNKIAQDYLRQRGLSAEIIQLFALGYAPEAWHFLEATCQDKPRAAALGLIRRKKQHDYDYFRGRIMFPIRNSRGQTLGFGGRLIAAGEPKYLNSPESPIFHKNQVLYGLYEMQQKRHKPEKLLVVEGYMDVISLFQHGYYGVVATLGTAINATHIQFLFRRCAQLVFCFDGDQAGWQAAHKAMQACLPFMQGGRKAYFLILPEGQDPDSQIRAEGLAAFQQRVQEAIPLSEFLIQSAQQGLNLKQAEDKAQFIARLRSSLQALPDSEYKEILQAEIATITQKKIRSKAPAKPRAWDELLLKPKYRAIALLLQNPQLAQLQELPMDWLAHQDQGIQTVLKPLWQRFNAQPQLDFDRLLLSFPESIHPYLQALACIDSEWLQDVEINFAHCLRQLSLEAIDQQIQAAKDQPEQLQKLLQKKQRLKSLKGGKKQK